MKDILIITSYFPPETGAASNRIFHLAEGLQKRDFKVSVLTPLPNYPTGKIFKAYRGKFKDTATVNGITIHRLWIYASISKNKLVRLFAMLSYSLSLIWYFLFHSIPKTVIVQSPPLIVAFTCCTFLKSKKRNLILNVSDLWPLAGFELGALKKGFSYSFLERIERLNYKKADLILGQSEEILAHVLSLFPTKKTFLYRNYPEFEVPKREEPYETDPNKIKLVYAGLLGVAQGLLKLCKALNYDGIEFHIYGAGAEQAPIEAYIAANAHLPIIYHGELPRNLLHSALLEYDVAIIPLLNRIYGSVPSKIFEYARIGLPLLYFGGGEGEAIISKYELGWVAIAGDYDHLNNVIASLKKSHFNEDSRQIIKATATTHFQFDRQLDQLVAYF